MTVQAQRATVLMSGGIDSAACAHFFRSQGINVDGLFIDHGQAAAGREGLAAHAIAEHLSMPLRCVTLSGGGCHGSGELVGRNAFLLFSALLVTRGEVELLAIGLHAGTRYYDCSATFANAIGKLVAEYTDGRVSVIAPFLEWAKRDIYDYFVSAHLPIGLTYSCEAGGDPVCGTCASCCDRKALGC